LPAPLIQETTLIFTLKNPTIVGMNNRGLACLLAFLLSNLCAAAERDVTRERLSLAVARASLYMIRHCDKSGRFVYRTHRDPEKKYIKIAETYFDAMAETPYIYLKAINDYQDPPEETDEFEVVGSQLPPTWRENFPS